MGGFLSGLYQTIGPHLQEQHEQELALQAQKKSGEYNTYWGSMQTAATRLSQLKQKGDALTPEEEKEAQNLASQYAWSEQQLNKLTKSSKPLNEAFQKVGGFVKQILSRPSPNGKLQPPGQQPQTTAQAPVQPTLQPPPTTAQAPSSDATAIPPSPSKPLQPPPPATIPDQPSMQGAMALANPAMQEQRVAEASRTRRAQLAKDLKLSDRERVEFIETGKMPTPEKIAPVAARRAERWKVGDTEIDVDFDPKTGTRYDPQGNEWDVPEGAQRVASKTSIARPTIIASDYVNLDDAKALKDSGAPFLGTDGKELDITKIPKGMVLQKIHFADGRTLYEPRNINDKVVKFNNQVFAVNPSQVQNIPQGAGVLLGQANTGAVSTHEVMAQDAAGNPVAQQLVSTRTPLTPGVPGRVAPTAAPPAGSAPVPTALAATAPGGRSRLTPPAGGGVRIVAGMTPGQAEHVTQRAIPVREAATQLFGDPSNPEIKGLMDFSKLADDPKSRERLGKAFKLTLDWMEHGSSGGHVRADAGPVSVAIASPMEWIENYFNMPANIASQRAGIMQKAMQDLTPEEREAYNATMASFGTIVGLRSLSRASASQASVQTIEREMPIIGVNTADSSQFADQMARLAEIINNGSRDKSIQAVMKAQTPGLLERIQGLPAEAKKLKDLARKPSPNGKLTPPGKTVKMKAPNGDIMDVAADQVAHYKSRGAQVVQ